MVIFLGIVAALCYCAFLAASISANAINEVTAAVYLLTAVVATIGTRFARVSEIQLADKPLVDRQCTCQQGGLNHNCQVHGLERP